PHLFKKPFFNIIILRNDDVKQCFLTRAYSPGDFGRHFSNDEKRKCYNKGTKQMLLMNKGESMTLSDETITAVSKLLNISKEELIKETERLFKTKAANKDTSYGLKDKLSALAAKNKD
ncbi:TPA: hypothetical protein ACHFPT_003924, partial [Enterobacter hormaechei]